MTARINITTKEFIEVDVTDTPPDVDLSDAVVEFAFTVDNADPTVWHTGEWIRELVAGCFIGAGGVILDAGRWWAFLRITPSGGVERPVRPCGVLDID